MSILFSSGEESVIIRSMMSRDLIREYISFVRVEKGPAKNFPAAVYRGETKKLGSHC